MKTVEFRELGFPILLVNPPMINIRGHEVPDINMKMLQETLLRALVDKPARLTGAEVRFVRKYTRTTQKDLARLLGQANHSGVSQWESREDDSSGMKRPTEALLRIWMAARTGEEGRIKDLMEQTFTEALRRDPTEPLRIDLADVA
jgi:DNA-binding transcriptional regulator YiaG